MVGMEGKDKVIASSMYWVKKMTLPCSKGPGKYQYTNLTFILSPPLIDSHSQNPPNSTTIPAVLLNRIDQI